MTLKCEKCSSDNRDIAKYCKYCGAKIISSSFRIDDLIGREEIKQEIRKIINIANILDKKRKAGHHIPTINNNIILMGNTGTGKTKIGYILSNIFYRYGIIKDDEPVIVDASDFGSFVKDIKTNFKNARGKILIIDNVHKLLPSGYSNEVNPIDRLFLEMGKSNYDPTVILSGHYNGLKEYLKENPSVKVKFKYIFELRDFNADELYAMAINRFEQNKYSLTQGADKKLKKIFKYSVKTKDDTFTNSYLANALFDDTLRNYFLRICDGGEDNNVITPEDISMNIPEEKTENEVINELDAFVGMHHIKRTVKEMINQIKLQKERIKRGIGKDEKASLHIVITGNPGTGKTTVARKLGEIFQLIGFLKRGHVVEVTRKDLVGEYVGSTAPKTNKKIDEAMGGILFIDEAYTLAPDTEGSSDQFGREAIEAIMKRMEDDRDEFVVIAAGYKEEMERFLNINPGIKSRFDRYIHFSDYNAEELMGIFKMMLDQKKYKISEEAEAKLKKVFQHMYDNRVKNFGNGREVRKLFEKIVSQLSTRMSNLLGKNEEIDNEILTTILPEDIIYELPKKLSIKEVMGELDNLIGMTEIKSEIKNLMEMIEIQKKRAQEIGEEYKPAIHMVITGNPGTGKTTVAKILGEVFKSLGILSKGHVVEVDRKDLVGQYVGSTPKKTDSKIDLAMNGVLFIDEAYSLAPEGVNDSFGQEAIATLLKRMEDDRGKFMVIAAGYPKEMENFLNTNPGLKSRFNKYFHLEDYTPPEMVGIFKIFADTKKYKIEINAEKKLEEIFTTLYANRDKNFANGREVRNIFEKCIGLQAKRLSEKSAVETGAEKNLSIITEKDIPETYKKEQTVTVDKVLNKLNNLIGLSTVKEEVQKVINYLRVEKARAEKGGKESALNLHFVFKGNPGTGKTTVARILSEAFKAMGLLSKGQLVEVDRSGLVAEYVGQTAPKTNKVIDNAIGGVLFIDEAYTLAPTGGGTDFGKEAISTLLKRMEDDRGKFLVIAAGYDKEMEYFISSNPGLASRFTKYIDFKDYTPEEMKDIFKSMASMKAIILGEGVDKILQKMFNDIYNNRDSNFANGRTVRNIFEMVLQNQAGRIAELLNKGDVEPDILSTITVDDFNMINYGK
jgi:SpoVK/Ycf46/Vps4 family AAA+-type ATPase